MDSAKYRDGNVIYAANTVGLTEADHEAFRDHVNDWLKARGLKLGEGVIEVAAHALELPDGYTHDFILTAPLIEGDPEDVWVDYTTIESYLTHRQKQAA